MPQARGLYLRVGALVLAALAPVAQAALNFDYRVSAYFVTFADGKKLEGKLELSNLHERRMVVDMNEVEYLYNLGVVQLHTPILLGNYYENQPAQE